MSSSVDTCLQKIKTARTGAEIRQAIYNVLHECYLDAAYGGDTDLVARKKIDDAIESLEASKASVSASYQDVLTLDKKVKEIQKRYFYSGKIGLRSGLVFWGMFTDSGKTLTFTVPTGLQISSDVVKATFSSNGFNARYNGTSKSIDLSTAYDQDQVISYETGCITFMFNFNTAIGTNNYPACFMLTYPSTGDAEHKIILAREGE